MTIGNLSHNKNKGDNIINKEIIKVDNNNNSKIIIDKDMVGLKYPEITFDKIRDDSMNGKLITSFINFLTQLEIKLIYLEKEINVTKLNAFYTARTLYLQHNHVSYDDSKITKFHHIMSWLTIHKSTQLKGIASDKYLACKYVELKLGKNFCPHKIGVYNSVEEIDFEKLIKMGNVILKTSNGCHANVIITKDKTKEDIPKIKEKITFFYNRDYSFVVPEFFHSFSKKRIVLETLFIPIDELYEFKFMIFNRDIKMIVLCFYRNNKYYESFYDQNLNSIKENLKAKVDISIFDKIIFNKMKTMALKLSEDFPNFIRVDLYNFQNKIYLSELTFDSHSGRPAYTDIKYFRDSLKNWKRIDY